MSAAIETSELTRSFPSGIALDKLSLELDRGEVLALLGPNGAGKTTTVRLLNGVLRADSGTARVLGLDPIADGNQVRARTGVLTENAGFDNATATRRVDEMLDRFGMRDRADDFTQGFSTGQRKRVALARALLHDPELLFLDEPTSGLDPAGTRDVIDLISTLSGEGRTIILATHFLGEAGKLADRMAVLHKGRLQAFGTPHDLARDLWQGTAAEVDTGRPLDEPTSRAVASMSGVLEVEVVDTGVHLRIDDREVLPRVVAELVGRGLPVYGAAAHPPTLEDVYFAIESRIVAESGEAATDAFLSTREGGS